VKTFYDGTAVKKWIIPIRPEFHQKLFTDVERRQTTLAEHGGGFLVEGNAIKKAYLCNAKTKQMAEGDIVLFYRSVDASAITSLGVVEEVYTGISDTDQILRLVGKRTVYSPEEIEEFDKPLTIVLFRHITHLKTPLGLDLLKGLGILKTAPMTINNTIAKPAIALNQIKLCAINESNALCLLTITALPPFYPGYSNCISEITNCTLLLPL
jgi:hypothetical protein